MKQKNFIDSHKGSTGILVLILMAIYHQWGNPTAWIYLALHGTYGVLWVLKSRVFPDQAWEKETGWGFGLVIWGSLSLYWVAPWVLMARNVQAPLWLLGLCISLFTFGIFAHFVSDMQKSVALQLQPEHLITDRMFARVRNPNYLGELLIYGAFAILTMHWLPAAILLVWIVFYWLPRMRKKDQTLATLEGFREYRKKSKLFLPFL